MKKILILGDQKKKVIRDTIAEMKPLFGKKARLSIIDLSDDKKVSNFKADMAFVFGGDGSILAACRKLNGRQVPLVGVHMGKFGFLTEFTPKTIIPFLDKILSGEFTISQRMLLDCRVIRSKKVIKRTIGLNDAVMSRASLSKLILIKLYIDGEEVTTYSCDGLILSTPAGSTAHSLSAGGPIVTPDIDAFLITPICPHTLSNRPLVISSNSSIEMEHISDAGGVGLTIDGQIYVDIKTGDKVIVEKAKERLQLVDTKTRTFYGVLREKLNWRGQPTYDVN